MTDQAAAPQNASGTDGQDGTGNLSDIAGTFLAVVYDNYQDPAFRPLTGAVEQVKELADILAEFGYHGHILQNPGQGSLIDGLDQWSDTWSDHGGHGPAIVAWSGHAETDNARDLQLITHATRKGLGNKDRYYDPERLASQALASRADQILILLDTCHSGAGAIEVLDHALNAWANRSLPEPRTAWIGVLAACQAHEKAAGARGLLLDTVLRLLRDGPRRSTGTPRPDTPHPESTATSGTSGQDRRGLYRHEWSVRNEGITGEALALAAMEDWPDSGQSPVRASVGRPAPLFRNPLWRPRSGEALVEHLVLAARGIDPTEEGWFFTGRRRVLGEITNWLQTGGAGMLLLTGSAGAGKSAVAGRIAALSDPAERAALLAHAPLTDDDPDPGEGSVDAAVHLRGMDPQNLAEALAYRLGLSEPKTPADLIAMLERSDTSGGRRRVLVLDGLDEASPGHAAAIAEQLLVPLSRLCTVLLSSRDRPFQPHQKSGETIDAALTRTVGAAVRILDLDLDLDTAKDITGYVRHRLQADGIAERTADDIAPVLAERAGTAGGGFLFARIVASHLARTLATDPARSWREQIPAGIADALTRDLAAVPTRQREGHQFRHAATDLLTALAWAAGSGMPAHGIWETVAQALSSDDTPYGPDDIDWLLHHYGRYIVEDSDGHQAVYRLYHRELITHLRAASDRDGDSAALAVVQALVALTFAQTANGTSPEQANSYLQRHLPDQALAAGGPGVTALRQLTEVNPAAYLPDLAGALNNLAIRLSGVGRREEALAPAEEAATTYRALAAANPAAYLPDLAMALNTLAIRLSEVGRREEALAPAEEAVRLRRALAAANPAAYLPNLAGALSNLAVRLSGVGRREEALAPAEEAATTYRALAAANPAAYFPNLAGALNNLANQLSEVGRREEALAPAEEAATTYRALAAANPAAYLPDLAMALNNLAIQLSGVGRREEALAPAEEAATTYRALAAANPAAYLPDLAGVLNNLAIQLSGVGRREEALAPAEEAATTYRALAAANPAAYLPNLAGALNTFAIQLSGVGRREEALAPAEEAATTYRALAAANPAAYLPDLASALNNLAIRLSGVGRREEALAPAEEAVRLRRALAAANPAAYLPNLASALNTLANRLSEVGRHEEALAPAEEAVRLRRALAAANPAAYLPDLAGGLSNLAVRLSGVGRRDEALAPAEEAATTYRALAAANPAAYLPDLAGALSNLANQLSEVGRREEALAPAEEAVRLRRALAAANPAAYLPDLAGALNTLAIQLSEVGRRDEALAPAEEAATTYRALAAANPAAYLPDLAMALNTFANQLSGVGRREEALAPAEEAATTYRALAAANPAAYLPNLTSALNNLANQLSEVGRREEALERYQDFIDAWPGPPQGAAELAYHRAVFLLELDHAENTSGIEALCALLTAPGPVHGKTVLQIHQHLREAVGSNPAVREIVTRLCPDLGPASAVPPWLNVTGAALQLTADWMKTETWAESHDFVTTHPALLDTDSLAALREWALLGGPASLHIELLEQLLSGVPVDTVYRPLVLSETLTWWIRASASDEGWAASEAYLAEHADDLLGPEADAVLATMSEGPEGTSRVVAVHRGILATAASDGIDTAYRLLDGRRALHTRIQKALEAADGSALGWLALIEDGAYNAPWAAAVHWLTAQALEDTPTSADSDDKSDSSEPRAPAAVRAAAQAADLTPTGVLSAAAREGAPDADDRNRAVAELAALLAARPTRAAALGELLQAVLATTVQVPEE
ncbi:tetratricopeptide repeat protein [Streptomyces sp. NPDC060011]|uniref:tetratricopeptide repeat protein n=1 Tax=Streptomyces sp. NPDC060011 TaxID=3347037 RepID=UPI00368EAC98